MNWMILFLLLFLVIMLIMASFADISSVLVLFMLEVIIYMISISKTWFHVVILIIMLEFMSLKAFSLISLTFSFMSSPIVIFLLLVMMVVEASLGMSLVVMLTRNWNEDSLSL